MSEATETTATVGVPAFDRSPTTNHLIDLYAATKQGDLLTDAEITDAVGCTRDAWQNCMTTVKKVLAERYNIVLIRERGVGYRHATDEELAGPDSSHNLSRINRAAARGVTRIVSGIKDHSKVPHARLAQMHLAAHATSAKATKILESTKTNNGAFDISTTLDAFKRRLPG